MVLSQRDLKSSKGNVFVFSPQKRVNGDLRKGWLTDA